MIPEYWRDPGELNNWLKNGLRVEFRTTAGIVVQATMLQSPLGFAAFPGDPDGGLPEDALDLKQFPHWRLRFSDLQAV